MKNRRTLQKWSCLAAALILALPCAALAESAETTAVQTAFAFRGGITWATTAEEVLALEGLTDKESYTDSVYGKIRSLQFTSPDDGQLVAFMFYQDELTLLMGMYESEEENNFEVQRDVFVAKYGEPTAMDKQELYDTMDIFGEDSLSDENLTAFAGWKLDDGSLIYLIDADGEVGALFFQMDRFEALLDYILAMAS